MEEKWIDKLKKFETPPPAGLWDLVASALDEERPPLAQKLLNFEAPPPPAAWDRIAQQLDQKPEEAGAPVIELSRRRSFAPYLAAAALIGILLVGAALLFNRPGVPAQGDGNLARIDTPASKAAMATAPVSHAEDSLPVNETAANSVENHTTAAAPAGTLKTSRSAAASTKEKTTYHFEGSESVAANATASANSTYSFSPANGLANMRASNLETAPQAWTRLRSATPAPTASAAPAHHVDDERYLVRAYNNGSVVRFSKKVSPVVDCAENATGFTQSLCRVSIGAVQDKLATAVTTDFGSLMERLLDLEKSSR
jgi:hypothetical protein